MAGKIQWARISFLEIDQVSSIGLLRHERADLPEVEVKSWKCQNDYWTFKLNIDKKNKNSG